MPLDPQAAAVIAQLERDGLLHDPSMSATQMRALAAQRPRPSGEPVADVTDLAIVGGDATIGVRAYQPSGTDADSPLVAYFHGGGWVMGDLDSHDARCRALANRSGATIMSVGYRLAPEHRFPAAFDDAVAAVTWAAGHAAELGCDPARIAVAGDSAGGNLAAAAALAARNAGISLRLQALVYPVLDAGPEHLPSYEEHATGPGLTAPLMEWFLDAYAGDADRDDWRLAPLHASDLAGAAPALVITAGHDVLRDEGERYAIRLAESGVPVGATRYHLLFHGFLGFVDEIDAAAEALDRIGAALRAALA